MRGSAIWAVLLLGACTQVDTTFVEGSRGIQVGVSDRRAVEQMLGAPQSWSYRGAEEVWIYATKPESSGSSRLASIPVIGEAFGASRGTEGRVKHVTIVFRNNVVTSCKVVVNAPDAPGQQAVADCSALE